ncbi:inorganic phosphate transporter [Oleidesulfovibrio sp.]|uniref:inorganic phosphate transporter n=1 Tax=Oleidesulfovibrio sp. TaxID=2909707 RepID=UPI003A881F00
MSLIFLSSGLFLGWSLGANDAANVFGTAVGSRMVKFRTAAICCGIFVLLGAVVSGAGASETLGKLGAIDALGGAFVVAFAAAVSVYLMTRARYPASTSQAIVGAIIGWNFFSGTSTDTQQLTKIVMTWVACPLLSAAAAVICYKLVTTIILRCKIHLFKLDTWTRYGLIIVGAFGSYSLGANNIANVVGVFVPVSPFTEVTLFNWLHLSSAQILFFIGGIAIAVGVFTYSKETMMTVGGGIFRLSPVMAFVAVWAHSVVLFLFSSKGLESWLLSHGLPALPLVPVSSSQAIVGAVIGMGLLKGGRGIRWKTVGGIACSWIAAPVFACIISYVCLSILQNVFHQRVYDGAAVASVPPAVVEFQDSINKGPAPFSTAPLSAPVAAPQFDVKG